MSIFQLGLALLLVLTVTTLNYGAQNSLPHVSYIKAIDVWFLGNFCLFQKLVIALSHLIDQYQMVKELHPSSHNQGVVAEGNQEQPMVRV